MKSKFLGKYRIESLRAQWWNYSNNGAYFITICTENRAHYFGEIKDGKMILSETGKIAQKCWDEIPEHFPFVELGAFVVMPDHVHGIIIIDKREETQNFVSPQSKNNQFGPQSKNLASIIRGFKIGVTKFSKAFNPDFKWQAKYHDIIIRDQNAFENISKYIENNPKNWKNKN